MSLFSPHCPFEILLFTESAELEKKSEVSLDEVVHEELIEVVVDATPVYAL